MHACIEIWRVHLRIRVGVGDRRPSRANGLLIRNVWRIAILVQVDEILPPSLILVLHLNGAVREPSRPLFRKAVEYSSAADVFWAFC